jgi:hypothetical protein
MIPQHAMEPGRTRSVGADYQKVWAAGSKLHHSCFMPVSWPFFKATCFNLPSAHERR